MRRVPLKFDGGVNLLVDPKALGPNELAYAKNLYPALSGELSLRPVLKAQRGWKKEFGVGTQLPHILGATCNPAAIPQALSMMTQGATAAKVWSGTPADLYGDTASDEVSLSLSLDANAEGVSPCWVEFNNELYLFVGAAPGHEGFYRLRLNPTVANGAEWRKETFNLVAGTAGVSTQLQTNPVSPAVACVYRGRMVMGNFGPGHAAKFTMSDGYPYNALTPPTDVSIVSIVGEDLLSFNGRAIDLSEQGMPAITGMTAIQLVGAGTEASAAVLIMGEESAFLIKGAFAQTTTTLGVDEDFSGDMEISRINVNAGCSSQATIVKTPYGTLWAGPDDVWIVDREQVPRPIGTKIRRALQACPAASRAKWNATYFDGWFRLQIATGLNQFESGGVGENAEHAVTYESWWLDLRNGAPNGAADARWWGPQVYVPKSWVHTEAAMRDCYISNHFVYARPGEDKMLACMVNAPYSNDGISNISSAAFLADVLGDGAHDEGRPAIDAAPYWEASTEYTVNDVVRALRPNAFDVLFKCAAAGTSDVAEPTWDSTPGALTGDGTASWIALGILDGLQVSTGANEYGNEVIFDLVFRDEDFGEPTLKKILGGVEVSMWAGGRQTLNLVDIKDQGIASQAQSSRHDFPRGALLGSLILDGGVNSENNIPAAERQRKLIAPEDTTRIIAHHHQLRLYPDTKYLTDRAPQYTVDSTRPLNPEDGFWNKPYNGGIALAVVNRVTGDIIYAPSGVFRTPGAEADDLATYMTAVVATMNNALAVLNASLGGNGFSDWRFTDGLFINDNVNSPGTERNPLARIRFEFATSPVESDAGLVIYLGDAVSSYLYPSSRNIMETLGFVPDDMNGLVPGLTVVSAADNNTFGPWVSPKHFVAARPVTHRKPVKWLLNALVGKMDFIGRQARRDSGRE